MPSLRGKPAPLHLCGLFLLDPDSVAKMDEAPASAVFAQARMSAIHKAQDRLKKTGKAPPNLLPKLLDLLSGCPDSPELDLLRRASVGDAVALVEANALGPWAYRRAGMQWASATVLELLDFFVDIERRSSPVEALLARKQFEAAARAIQSDQVLHRVAPEAVPLLVDHHDTLRFSIVGAIRVLVAQLALLEHLRVKAGREQPDLGFLLVGRSEKVGPGGRFIAWLKGYLGAASISGLLDLQVRAEQPIDEATWKRWHSGAVFPSERRLHAFVVPVLEGLTEADRDARYEAIAARFWAARRLHHARHLICRLRASGDEQLGRFMGAPESADQWLASTLDEWRSYWRQTGALPT